LKGWEDGDWLLGGYVEAGGRGGDLLMEGSVWMNCGVVVSVRKGKLFVWWGCMIYAFGRHRISWS
jgi:hypothetical protein